MKKIRILSLLLTLCMVLSFLPAMALEVEAGLEESIVKVEDINVSEDLDSNTADVLTTSGEPEQTPEAEMVDVTVNIKYVEFAKYDSGGSHYNNAAVTDGEPQVFTCTPNESNTLELDMPDDGYVIEASFLGGNTDASVLRGMDGSVNLVTTPTKNASITVKVGQQWTSRVYVYNMVLVNGAYTYQHLEGNSARTSATVLMPKGADASESFGAPDARETAYLSGNLQPAISGDYADYEYSGRYLVTYYDGDTMKSATVADTATGLNQLGSYGLQIDSTTGEITSDDGQTSPTLTGNQYFSVYYYLNRPGESEQGNVYTYSFFEDAAGAFPYGGKNYKINDEYNAQMKQNIGSTATYEVPEADGYVYSGSALYQFNSAGKWVPLANDAFDFSVTDKAVSVTTQQGFLAFYNYFDAAGTVTVNRVYDSDYSSQPVFDGQPEFTDTANVKVALGKTYTADAASGRDGYTLVTDKTEVVGGDTAADEKGSVTVTMPGEKDSAVTVTYYYYRQLSTPTYPDPDYKISVKYVDMDGNELAKSSVTSKSYNASYDVTEQAAKAIAGYTIDHVDGAVTGRVKGAVTITVYYKAEESDKPEKPEIELPDEELPLADLPTTELPEEDVPTAPGPDVTEESKEDAVILEPEVAMGNLPQTGAVLSAEFPVAVAMGVLALLVALTGVAAVLKKRKEENI